MENAYFIVTIYIIFDSLLRRECHRTIDCLYDGIKALSINSIFYAITISSAALKYGCDMRMVLTNVAIITILSVIAFIISDYEDLPFPIISAIPTIAAIIVTLNYNTKLVAIMKK